jgi:hypothetical protein
MTPRAFSVAIHALRNDTGVVEYALVCRDESGRACVFVSSTDQPPSGSPRYWRQR